MKEDEISDIKSTNGELKKKIIGMLGRKRKPFS